MTLLRLAKDLTMPASAITETFGILAVRGAGKSNTAAVMAEEMFKARLPFVVIDPVRAWWGLRSSRDGKGAGLPIPIFGGKHGDVPLERGGGQLIADLIVDQRLSCVLDISDFDSESAKKQFLIDFARRLYQRNEEPLHLFLEEADDYIPQKPMGDEKVLLRAWENIVRRGRGRGLGMTLITQRSAVINKNVLTQVQTLIAMRTTGPQDVAAIEAWLKYHQQGREILESLPSLDDGEAWVWSPRFLKKTARVRFRMRDTFDSGATPKMSKEAKKPATLADVDLKAVKAKMEATIERAKAEDPRALRQTIEELKRQVKACPTAVVAGKVEINEVPVLEAKDRKQLEKSIKAFEATARRFAVPLDTVGVVLKNVEAATAALLSQLQRTPALPVALLSSSPHASFETHPFGAPVKVTRQILEEAGSIRTESFPQGERLVLTAIAQYPEGISRDRLTVLTGYKRTSRDTYLQKLVRKGYVEVAGQSFRATGAGIKALGPGFQPLPTGSALREYWLHRLPGGERRIYEVLVTAWPGRLSRADIGAMTNYKRTSVDTYLQKLNARSLVQLGNNSQVKASDKLFD